MAHNSEEDVVSAPEKKSQKFSIILFLGCAVKTVKRRARVKLQQLQSSRRTLSKVALTESIQLVQICADVHIVFQSH